MKTKIYKFFCYILCIILLLAGCSGQADPEKTYDQDFLEDLTKGLVKRWDINDEQEGSEYDLYTLLVQTELDNIEEYSEKNFEDTILQEKAIVYINLLKLQKEALTYFDTDYDKYTEMWAKAYNERTKMVKTFIEEYNLEFPERHADMVDGFIKNAKVVMENEEFNEKIDQMVQNVSFKFLKNSYSYNYYEGIVENLTDKTFECFNLKVKLIDDQDVILDTETVSIYDMTPGQKVRVEFSTDKNFVRYEIQPDFY